MPVTEDRAAIDALEFYEPTTLKVGLLSVEETDVVVVPRDAYVSLVTGLLSEFELPPSVVAELLHTARTADRFAVGSWVEGERGCGCLVGEYLIAQHAIEEHNDALDVRRVMADTCTATREIRSRLYAHHEAAVAETLVDVGYRMNDVVTHHLAEHVSDVMQDGTVFIRDEVVA